jgi:hypothetical protein
MPVGVPDQSVGNPGVFHTDSLPVTAPQPVNKPKGLLPPGFGNSFSVMSAKVSPPLMTPMDLLTDINNAVNDVVTAQGNLDKALADVQAAANQVAQDTSDLATAIATKNPFAIAAANNKLNQDTAKLAAAQKAADDAKKALDQAKANLESLIGQAIAAALASGGGSGGSSGPSGDGGGGGDSSGGGGGDLSGGGGSDGSGGGSDAGPAGSGDAGTGASAAGDSGQAGDVQDTAPVLLQDERFIQVQNDTGKPVSLWIQVRTRTNDGTWAWLPVDPRKESKGFAYDLEAGEKTYLAYQDGKLKGSRIRFWVKSEAGEWNAYRDRDLWLVPEVDAAGNHVYQADQIETFPLRLSR